MRSSASPKGHVAPPQNGNAALAFSFFLFLYWKFPWHFPELSRLSVFFGSSYLSPPAAVISGLLRAHTKRVKRDATRWLAAGRSRRVRAELRAFIQFACGRSSSNANLCHVQSPIFLPVFFSVCVFASRATVGSRTLACHWLLLLLICIKLNSARLGRTLDGDVTLMNCRGVWERTAVSCLRRSLLPCTGGSALCVNINHYYRANWKKNKKNKYKRNKHFISRQRAEMLDGGPSRWEAPRQSLSHVCLWMNLRK